MNFSEMGPRPKLRPKNENHWPVASDAMFDHFLELLRHLRYTLLEHQFQTWITRNEAQPVRDHKTSYARPKQPTRPSSPPKAQPKPQRKKKRKRRSKEDAFFFNEVNLF